jgi:pyruvate,water dikinase
MMLFHWEAIWQAGPTRVGGKAWHLARLARYGFNVPAGIVIPVAGYSQWLKKTGLEKALLAARHQPEVLAAMTTQLAEIPSGLDLSKLPLGALAVRSSAPQEDSANASFAGIHASCLNVLGGDAAEQAIRSVWCSLWTPTAIAYRERIGLAHQEATMAVLIMPLVASQISGVAFSRDPISGRDDRMLIHAVRGLGESLVSGRTTGDEMVLEEDLLDDHLLLLQRRPGNQTVRTDPAPGGGTQTRQVDTHATDALSESQVLQLGQQVRLAALALDYTMPDFDLEWTWDGNQFWLLQARPITAANRCTYPELVTQPDIWSRGNTCDVLPDPLSPFDWGNSRRLVNALLEQGFKLSGLKLHPGVQRAGLFYGRLYLNFSLMQWEGYASIGLKPEAMNRLIGGHQPTIKVPSTFKQRLTQSINILRYLMKAPARRKAGRAQVDEIMARVAQWNAQPLPQSDCEYVVRMKAYARYTRCAHDLHFLQGAASGALSFLVDTINACLPGEGHAQAAALMTGKPLSVTAQQGYDLVMIAKQAVADRFTRQWLEQRCQRGDDQNDWRDLPESSPLRQAFTDFLKRYGHRGVYETYTRNPRWREQPGYLLDNLLELAKTDLDAQENVQREAYDKAKAKVSRALPWWKRPLLDGMVRSAKAGSNEREVARSAMIAQLEPGRRLLLGLGERWVDAQWLGSVDDIFFLLHTEITAVLEGTLPGSVMAPRIIDRKKRFKAWFAQEAPDVILKQPDGSTAELAGDNNVFQAEGDCFTGVPVGTGFAKGTARLLANPQQGEQLASGEILVVSSTDPAWTPLFLRAAGLVMETGGYLSHGAIVAREFGIPAVVNLPGILEQLRDGDRLVVDGVQGTVQRLRSSA